MAQVDDISKYLSSDEIFNKISKQFISLNPNDVKYNNVLLLPILKMLENAMRQQSPLFDKTFGRIMWAGSYYKGTRYDLPEEYDLNFIINLPIKEKDIEFRMDRPGYIKILTNWKERNTHNTLNLDPSAYRELDSLIDEESYLNQNKFRTWIEGILCKVANVTGGNSTIKFDGFEPIKMKKSGPAFTLMFKLPNSGKIDVDVVPAICFSARNPPPRCSKMNILQSQPHKYWSVVPKPLSNNKGDFRDLSHRYWRLCFYDFEKDILCNHNYARMKPIIRQLKKLRTNQQWNNVASYYLETLCYHEKEMFHISQKKSFTFLFFTMLEKLRDAFHRHCIRYYWDDDLNLLENIGFDEMRNMERRLDYILKTIRKTIKHDRYAIAKWVLDRQELEILKSPEPVTVSESESDPASEGSSQWNCVIV